MSSVPSDDPLAAIREAVFAGRKIEAIKLHREATGSGLAESKEAVEALERELRATHPDRFGARPRGGGCAASAALLLSALLVVLAESILRA